MGASYQNEGLNFAATLTPAMDEATGQHDRRYYEIAKTPELTSLLARGDEFLVNYQGENENPATAQAIYTGSTDNSLLFYADKLLTDVNNISHDVQPLYQFFLYRSGKRNLLTAKVGSVTALSNPLAGTKSTVEQHEIDIANLVSEDCPEGWTFTDEGCDCGDPPPPPEDSDIFIGAMELMCANGSDYSGGINVKIALKPGYDQESIRLTITDMGNNSTVYNQTQVIQGNNVTYIQFENVDIDDNVQLNAQLKFIAERIGSGESIELSDTYDQNICAAQ